ncbi:hypothetical protein [Bathymodiolus septemdierum thioautotrophic gill symbiont]|uniref:Uncharacterized protein n=1 Tax=endosymbiont of Bathymodiolus septemdierum str. Myojin knoll TaxID=1303921 RepID=A0A0P0URS0_9GAMM|nr:hypothetical protein [Bathymodiolus septemdierum thioautotrophic gill symbiont]BAS67955.1 hypothetical protein BSEPE_0964 [endosymbiont of Bathymodiolus septemdierum str. Myojin knoll]
MICFIKTCIVSAQLLNSGSYNNATLTTVVDSNNVVHDISTFYKVQNNQFNLRGYLIFNSNTRVDLYFDSGLKSQKRNRSKALIAGVTQLVITSNNSHISFGVSTKFGGKTTEVACTDDSGTGRQFFCDNLATLEPFTQPKNNVNTKVELKYRYKF